MISRRKKVMTINASGGGRMVVTMDRYNADWNIVKRGWMPMSKASAGNLNPRTSRANLL